MSSEHSSELTPQSPQPGFKDCDDHESDSEAPLSCPATLTDEEKTESARPTSPRRIVSSNKAGSFIGKLAKPILRYDRKLIM